MNIYDLIEEYKKRPNAAERSVAAVMNDLNDRKGIKQALQSIDDDVLEEMFESLADEIRCCIAAF